MSLLPESLRAKGALTAQELADFTRQRKQSIDKQRMLGKGPPYTRCGRSIIYPVPLVEKWLQDNTFGAE
jgi:hypothetical protein